MYWYYIVIAFILFIISLVIIKIKRKDFHLEINKLIQYLGGYDNIIDSQINLSRLKVTLKDTSIVNKEGIQKLMRILLILIVKRTPISIIVRISAPLRQTEVIRLPPTFPALRQQLPIAMRQ